MRRQLFAILLATSAGCLDRGGAQRVVACLQSGRTPDLAPVMLDSEPFRYPQALWGQRVQGNVTLRLFVDSTGHSPVDSATVFASSGVLALDSAALLGVRRLHFRPAKLNGKPVSVTLLLPVFFRHPDAPPLPGDSVIKRIPPSLRHQ